MRPRTAAPSCARLGHRAGSGGRVSRRMQGHADACGTGRVHKQRRGACLGSAGVPRPPSWPSSPLGAWSGVPVSTSSRPLGLHLPSSVSAVRQRMGVIHLRRAARAYGGDQEPRGAGADTCSARGAVLRVALVLPGRSGAVEFRRRDRYECVPAGKGACSGGWAGLANLTLTLRPPSVWASSMSWPSWALTIAATIERPRP